MFVRVTLTGPFKDATVELNGVQFCDGVAELEASTEEMGNFASYFVRSYQAKAEYLGQGVAADSNVAVAEDDEPTTRQQKIMDAIAAIDKDEWVGGAEPHPKVADVAELMEDATVRKEEILEVIERWPS